MHTIRLRINDKIYKNLIWLLGKFNKEDLQIIEENDQFTSVQDYLKKELVKLDEGKEELIDLDDIDQELERTIKKYEN
ncbi:hypothetical protein ES708_21027 [subsurface metagenome]